MLIFLLGIALLILGYSWYGRFIENILGPDDRETPAVANHDGVDYVVLPHWKNMLIQLLNIAGIGPVIGVILGIKFGEIVFLIIPVGNVIGGAVHDFASGMMSLRHKGSNLPTLIDMTMGKTIYSIFSVFMTFLLFLVVAVFINIPAGLIDRMMPQCHVFWVAVGVIFLYYIIATIFPVDKIIGTLYPLFGMLLLIGTAAILISILFHYSYVDPDIFIEKPEFRKLILGYRANQPILPMLFVTIACGIMSGFHATQSPIIARTMGSERQARPAFYGMMIMEGVIAMIWAAGGFIIYNLFPKFFNQNATIVLMEITNYFLGSWMGMFTIIGVIILAITSGDTAMRSLRLSLAEITGISQTSVRNRILLSLPLIAVIAGLLYWSNTSAKTFAQLWNYFAWGNQVLASFTLIAASVWLWKNKKNGFVTILPGMFMTFIVLTYILWTSKAHGGPVGFGLDLNLSYMISIALALAIGAIAYFKGKNSAPLK